MVHEVSRSIPSGAVFLAHVKNAFSGLKFLLTMNFIAAHCIVAHWSRKTKLVELNLVAVEIISSLCK